MSVKVPVILASGLRAENAWDTVAVQPYGLDLCSEVRSDGRLRQGEAPRLHGRVPRRRAR
ncbi:MAG: hypothetical protein U0527_13485 [Candidatus Eisenbacteria bacterium]